VQITCRAALSKLSLADLDIRVNCGFEKEGKGLDGAA
jgi:hypothetical protein